MEFSLSEKKATRHKAKAKLMCSEANQTTKALFRAAHFDHKGLGHCSFGYLANADRNT